MSKLVINDNIEFLTLRHPKFPAMRFNSKDKLAMVNVYEFMTGKKFPEPSVNMDIPSLDKEGFRMISDHPSEDIGEVHLTIRSKIQGDIEVKNGQWIIKVQIHDNKDFIAMDDFDKDMVFMVSQN